MSTIPMSFDEPSALHSVGQFHAVFQLPILEKPVIPDAKRCELRVSLLQEELDELKDAIESKDIVGVADALCDLQYVLSGAIHEFGLGPKFKQLFEEVQRSNMSKTCKSMEEVLETQAYYKETKDTDSYWKEINGEFLIYRKEDNKVLKSVNYSEADLESIINA